MKSETTSKRVASAAARLLRDKRTSKDVKLVAASCLTQYERSLPEDAASGTWTTRNMFFDKPKRKRRKATKR